MVYFNHNFLLLISAFFFFSFFCLVESDENLINNLCSKTKEPSICKDCLHSDSKSASANGRGLALISIDCAELDLKQLHNAAVDADKTATGTLKLILGECVGPTGDALKAFREARGKVEKGEYGSARDIIWGQVVAAEAECYDAFEEGPDIPVPPMVLAGCVASRQTSEIVHSILGNI